MAKFKPRDGSIKFKDATQNMSTKEKVDYIWEYYKWLIFSSIAVVAIIFYTINTHNPNTHLHLVVASGFEYTSNQFQFDDLDDDHEDEEISEFDKLFGNPYGFMVDTEELSDTLAHLLLDDEQLGQYTIIVQNMPINIETVPVFTTLAGAGELDIVIAYQHDFDAMASVGHFRSIRDLDVDLPDHIFINDFGISLEYLPILNDYIHPNQTDTELVLGIVAASRRTEEVEDFLNVLFE